MKAASSIVDRVLPSLMIVSTGLQSITSGHEIVHKYVLRKARGAKLVQIAE
jgi:hypothetical protein